MSESRAAIEQAIDPGVTPPRSYPSRATTPRSKQKPPKAREKKSGAKSFKYGELYFEETGVTAQYLIIPDTADGRNPQKVLEFVAKSFTHNDEPIKKPSIMCEVRSSGTTYHKWADEIRAKPRIAAKWKWDKDIGEDDAMRTFSHTIVEVFSNAVKGIANAEGWFLFPSGREARQQLIGDAITAYGQPGDVVFVQYNNLQNPLLFGEGEDHDVMVEHLKACAVDLDENAKSGPKVTKVATYESEADHYVTKQDLTAGAAKVREKADSLGMDKGSYLHPLTTHLIFWDKEVQPQGDRQAIPVNDIEEFKSYLCNVKGVQDSTIVANGSMKDLQFGAQAVMQSNPVIALKNVCGASEKLSQIFDKLQLKEEEGAKKNADGSMRSQTTKRRGGMCYTQLDRDADGSPTKKKIEPCENDDLDEEVANFYFKPPVDAEARECIVVESHDAKQGIELQQKMAEMLTMRAGDDEKMIGFEAAEEGRIRKAWHWQLEYSRNAHKEKFMADVFNYLMLLLNFLLVLVVVMDQITFPPVGPKAKCEKQNNLAAVSDDIKKKADNIELWMFYHTALIVMPIIGGLLLTLDNAFDPLRKFDAMRWAAALCDSETYRYRARADTYATCDTSDSWKAPVSVKKQTASKLYVSKIRAIKTKVQSEGLHNGCCAVQYSTPGQEAKYMTKAIGKLYDSHIVSSDEKDAKRKFTDDGFKQLGAEEYLACRTEFHLDKIKKLLPTLSRQKTAINLGMYVGTGVSVLLGAGLIKNGNVYIAVSTAFVSLLTGMLSHQRLEQRLATLAAAANLLEDVAAWWWDLTFVEKRYPGTKDHLVRTTETAIMMEANAFFQSHASPKDSGSENGGEGGEGDKKKEGKKKQEEESDDEGEAAAKEGAAAP